VRHQDDNIAQGNEGLSKNCHEKNNENCDHVEADVNKNRALLDESEVHTQLFELPFDLFAEFFTPKLRILHIDIANQLAI